MTGCMATPNVIPNPLAAPQVVQVIPQTNGVGTNRLVGVLFSKSMNPASINSTSFTISGAQGSVSYDAINNLAYFKPSPNFTINTNYTATSRPVPRI